MEKVKTQAWDGFEAASSPAPGDLPSTRIALSLADDFWSYASITEFFFSHAYTVLSASKNTGKLPG
jgi:hypothetical protein